MVQPVLAQETDYETEDVVGHAHDPTDIWAIARGGQLYDNWMSVLEADEPTETHPAAYAKGSHYSGVKGVRGVVGMDPEKIHQIIMDETHGFTEANMTHSAMEKLALFLSRGQLDTDRYIDRSTAMARGNPRRGAQFYQTICAVCHGFDGRDINFKTEETPEFIGTVCGHNPWEALHKIRFGQPGVGMVALTVLETDDLVDIVAYCQTLPEK
jgi:thiosulfate dehydrogenase